MLPLSRIKDLARSDALFPPIDHELVEPAQLGYLRGRVMNAGAGWRDFSHLVEGELVNQDVKWPEDQRTNIHIFSPLHDVPADSGSFDAIVCLAVLEHVVNPYECVQEMHRLLRPGGRVIASVPFLQPEHKVPTDYQRYTKDGLIELFERHGFEVEDSRAFFNVYLTMHWIVSEWLRLRGRVFRRLMQVLVLVPLGIASQRSTLTSDRIASAFRVIARKPDSPT